MIRLHVNVDHVATLRQARGTPYPDPVEAAVLCEHAGADGITVHLREDRRHVQRRDVDVLRRTVKTRLNLEMAATDEMIAIATELQPSKVTLVPERREEQTTEGGLDVHGGLQVVQDAVQRLRQAAIAVSLFIDPEPEQVRASRDIGADEIELHTGDYANATSESEHDRELGRLQRAAQTAAREASRLAVAAGHGLTVRNTRPLVGGVPEVCELNIGHALIADSIYFGIADATRRFQVAIATGEKARREGTGR